MSRSSGEAGFTLIELLVALTLLGLVSVLLFGGLRFGVQAWRTGTDLLESSNAVEAAQNLLRRELAEAAPPVTMGERGSGGFHGEENRMSFIAPFPAHTGAGGLARYQLSFDRDAARLAIAWRRYRPDESGDSEPEDRAILLQGVAGAAFDYFGSPVPGGEAAWDGEWLASETVPAMVRVRIVFPAGDRRSWPDLVVAPRLAQAPAE